MAIEIKDDVLQKGVHGQQALRAARELHRTMRSNYETMKRMAGESDPTTQELKGKMDGFSELLRKAGVSL